MNDKPEAAPTEVIALAGGCFWCTEAVYVAVQGVLDVESGYSNGHDPAPTYEAVCSGHSGHAEVVKLVYDPAQVSLRALLEVFFAVHDPTTLNRQGHDVGSQYRSGIYWTTPAQAQEAQAVMDELATSGAYRDPIVTELAPLANYHPAEPYHQDFFERNPRQGYCLAVAAPKVAKLYQRFAHLTRPA